MAQPSARSHPPQVRQIARSQRVAPSASTPLSERRRFSRARPTRFEHLFEAVDERFLADIKAAIPSRWAEVGNGSTIIGGLPTERGFSISHGRAVRGLGRLKSSVTTYGCAPPEDDASAAVKEYGEYFAPTAEQFHHSPLRGIAGPAAAFSIPSGCEYLSTRRG